MASSKNMRNRESGIALGTLIRFYLENFSIIFVKKEGKKITKDYYVFSITFHDYYRQRNQDFVKTTNKFINSKFNDEFH